MLSNTADPPAFSGHKDAAFAYTTDRNLDEGSERALRVFNQLLTTDLPSNCHAIVAVCLFPA